MKKMTKKVIMMTVMMMLSVLMVMPAHAAKAKLNVKKAGLNVGETLQLKVKGKKKKANWKSSNKKVAAVSKKGKVTAKAPGKAKITVKIGGKKLTCKVTVTARKEATKKNTPVTAAPAGDGKGTGNVASYWKYTGNIYNVFDWSNLAFCNKQKTMNMVKARPYELRYNEKGNLTACIAVLNQTPASNYTLTNMYIELDLNGNRFAETEFYFNNIVIAPNTVDLVTIEFDHNTTYRIVDLSENFHCSISTN